VHLIPFIQNRCFGIVTHAGSTHFMDPQTNSDFSVKTFYVFESCCIEHFFRIIFHVHTHFFLIVTQDGIKV